jgi:SpoU rRNA methylase family enzyme
MSVDRDRGSWHSGRAYGLTEALEAVERVHRIAEEHGAGMAVMTALDEAVTQVELRLAGASDDARNEGYLDE